MRPLKTLGIIGGIAPESTIDYYRQIIAEYRRRTGDGHYPRVIINSIDLKRMLDLLASDRAALTAYLADAIAQVAAAGAEIGLLASNTPHIVFDDLRSRSPIPLISIVEAACRAAAALGVRKAGLFGTRTTMQGDFYPQVFSRSGIEVIAPGREDQDFIHQKYFGELVNGVFRDETREQMIAIASRMKTTAEIDVLILGGTELPLLLRGETVAGIPLLDTTKSHVGEAVSAISR